MPERIQRRRVKGWRMPSGAVYVGRGSEWGNPYRVGDHAMIYTPIGRRKPGVAHGYGPLITPQVAVLLFQVYIADRLDVIRAELAGRDLACWCPLDQPCHADILLKISNAIPEKPHSPISGMRFPVLGC